MSKTGISFYDIFSEQDWEKINKFIKENQAKKTGAIGGQFTYEFTPTTLGLVMSIFDNCSRKRLDLTDYKDW